MAVKIGSVAEGAFAIYLSLYAAQNAYIQKNSTLDPSLVNVKYWMKKIPIETFENGGTWNGTFYEGDATSKETLYYNQNNYNRYKKPIDILSIKTSISLKPKEVKGYYGEDFDSSLDDIINHMISQSARYKSQIDMVKKMCFNNFQHDFISINIKTIGKEGETTRGEIKGDISLAMEIIPLDKKTRKPIGNVKTVRFPIMYYSLKASKENIPKTVANNTPVETLKELANYFKVNPESSKNNKTIEELLKNPNNRIVFKVTKSGKSKKFQKSINNLFGKITNTDNKSTSYTYNDGEIEIPPGTRLFDFFDRKKFPRLPLSLRSYIVTEYVNTALSLIQNGKKSGQESVDILNFLKKSAFGGNSYKNLTTILSYSDKKYEFGSLKYLEEIEKALIKKYGEITLNVRKSGGNINFYLGNKQSNKYKLFQIRYKNSAQYFGNFNEGFDPSLIKKLDLKSMVETGPAFSEIENWKPGMELEFNDNSINDTIFSIKTNSQ